MVKNKDSCGMPHVRAALTPSESLEGQGASRHAWPWDVRLSMDTKIICYGAIIQPAWVLTAAHCLLGLPEQSLRSLSVETGGPKNQRQDVRRIVLHPQYDPSSQDYDVALLQLDSLLLITEHAQSVCLPCSGQEVPASQVCMLSSWEGQTGGPWNSTVEPLEVPLVSRADCERYNTGRLTPRMLCAGPPQPHGQDTCTGPGGSGGALVCQTEDSGYFILGVSIQKEGCGKFQRPGVYTSVPMLRDWIQEQLHEDSADSSRTMPYQEQQEEQAFSIDYDDNNYGAESSGESC